MGEDSWLKEGAWADLGTGSGALAIGLADCLSLPSKAGLLNASGWVNSTNLCLAGLCNVQYSMGVHLHPSILQVYAVDLSDQACAWASLNVQRHDMQPRIEV